jgi:hypothetical protein
MPDSPNLITAPGIFSQFSAFEIDCRAGCYVLLTFENQTTVIFGARSYKPISNAALCWIS